MKPLEEVSQAEYLELLTAGKLWDVYPCATGDWASDCQVSLGKLFDLLRSAHGDSKKQEKLYNLYALSAIQREGFNEAQASAILYRAYENGHSGGYGEVINCSYDYVEFAKEILARANTPNTPKVPTPETLEF